VHAVQSLFHPPTELDDWPDQDKRSRVVFITKDLSRAYVEEVLTVILSRAKAPHPVPQLLEQ
jgi:G3E family GTPase